MADEVKRAGRASQGETFVATIQAYQRSTAGSFFGSAGLLLLAEMAHTTIMPATISIYAPRANVPRLAIATPPLAFPQDNQARPPRASIVNFWLMPPSH
jgi:hypothetical protein